MTNYKESGVKWIGKIPDDWIIGRGKNCFRNIKRIVGMKHEETERLALTLNGVIKRSKENSNGLQPEKFDTYQYLLKNELVFKLIDLGNIATSRVGISNYDGMVSPAYIILRNNNSDNRFYYYFYLSMWHRNIFNSLGDNGVRSSLNAEDLLNVPIVIPKSDEQKKIADLLDKKCEQIDKLIEIQQQEIEKLKEYKTSVITQAVTKGLDPNVPMKDSGIEWIGKIPQDWKIVRLKYILDIFGRIGFRGYTQDDLRMEGEGAITLSPSNMKDLKMDYSKCSYISWEKYDESPEIKIKNGDVLFVKTGSTFGKSALVNSLPMQATINPQIIVFKNIKLNPYFIVYSLNTKCIKSQVDISVVGGTIPTISQEKISNYFIAIPNNYDKINEICDAINKIVFKIEMLLVNKQQKIEKLQEYKKSMIYEYVTGKRRVI